MSAFLKNEFNFYETNVDVAEAEIYKMFRNSELEAEKLLGDEQAYDCKIVSRLVAYYFSKNKLFCFKLRLTLMNCMWKSYLENIKILNS